MAIEKPRAKDYFEVVIEELRQQKNNSLQLNSIVATNNEHVRQVSKVVEDIKNEVKEDIKELKAIISEGLRRVKEDAAERCVSSVSQIKQLREIDRDSLINEINEVKEDAISVKKEVLGGTEVALNSFRKSIENLQEHIQSFTTFQAEYAGAKIEKRITNIENQLAAVKTVGIITRTKLVVYTGLMAAIISPLVAILLKFVKF